MRIEELVLEGFKSYPVRTQITGWDSSFNAITGLNGTGKSNILDAISFVLGLTNMATMRAANQTDLIYKRGQAGITKASVTIVFNNSDVAKSPTGYETHKQITVTRQLALPNVSKYLINGHKTTQQIVQTMFQSVQLNINNPNFVIMQGKITKVLNMRPQEILGMVEEAAGTRMFEDRKDKAIKTMAKKDKKVQEINALLAEEITPKLNKLRSEKQKFIEYQKTESELQRIERVLHAYEWVEGRKRVQQGKRNVEAAEKDLEKLDDKKGELQRELGAAEKEKTVVEKRRDQEQKKGGKLAKLEEAVGELDKELAKIRTQAEIKQGSIKAEEGRVEACRAEQAGLESSLQAKIEQVEKINAEHKAIMEKHQALVEKHAASEELLQSLLTGLSNNKANNTTGGGGYLGQIAASKQQATQAAAEEKQARTKLGMSESDLKSAEARFKAIEREAGDAKKKLDALRVAVETCRNKIAQCGWNEEKENQAEGRTRELRAKIRALEEERDRINQSLGYLEFNYNLGPNFDRKKVRGRVAMLLSLSPENYPAAQALEIAAGSGKLQSVVVDDEQVGKMLLTSGLEKKVTIIPLNKIQPRTINAQKLRAVENIGGDKVRPAISLVKYDEGVRKAMEYVFSDTLICDDAKVAEKVTFADSVRLRSVTMNGDVYDPSGTLTGGAPPQTRAILVNVQKLLDADEKIEAAKGELRELDAQLAKSQRARDEWKARVKELDMKQHELKLSEEQVGGSNAAQLGAQVDQLKQTIAQLTEDIKAAQEKQADANAQTAKLERDMAEFKNNKDGKIDELKADIQKQSKAIQKDNVAVKLHQKEQGTAEVELDEMKSDIEKAQSSVKEAQSAVETLRRELTKLEKDVNKKQDQYDEANAKLTEERATLKRFDDELQGLDKAIKTKKQAIADADVAVLKLTNEKQNLEKEITSARKHVERLEKEHEWIQQEKEHFGKTGGQYDFAASNVPTLKTRADDLAQRRKGMKKSINPKVLAMIDTVEKKESDLKEHLDTVFKDKAKIERTIGELDTYKRTALEATWKKVDEDFGAIFGELLPGNDAKLQPPEGQDLMQGLEVKVKLGQVWKQSLTELSGGQRSLIALSLIMALLQFKPAPMYILDEIDAALDLSHTQHIGQLFRTRFKGSQFIVVSLKEGLFTNANVLFRTRFRDGTSIVERTETRSGGGSGEAGGSRRTRN